MNKFANLFYKSFPEDYDNISFNKNDYNIIDMDEDNLKFCQMVFSSDPLTGNPQSEIAYMLSGSDEGFKQFLKDKLFNPIPEGSLAEDADTAMQLVHKNVYTQEQFAEICRDYVTNMMLDQQKGGD